MPPRQPLILPGGDRVAWVVRKARTKDGFDGGMDPQPLGEQPYRLALRADSQIKRPQSPQEKEGVRP
jgi:hypothetical protein